jgi:NAD(P)-dependent dehydrogenase (short-subunit alcohol dehydrogenase family)
MTNSDLAGRRALVTGGNRGLGRACVRALADAGASVGFTARSEAKVAEALAGLPAGVEGRVADATDRAAMAALLAEGLDILVNNAGVIEPIGPLDRVPIDAWARTIEINLVAAFFAAQQAIAPMLARGGGTIVNVSSGAARGAMEGWSAYCASKAGLAMVTQSLHKEFGDRGIRVFGFAPGVVDTDMQATIRASGINPVSRIPRENLAPADGPARAIAWLCTPAADPLAGRELDIRHEDFRRAAGLPPLA